MGDLPGFLTQKITKLNSGNQRHDTKLEEIIMKLDLIGILVTDMQRSLEFYRALGWEIPTVSNDEDHVEIVLENGLRFAWDKLSMIQSYDPTAQMYPHGIGAFLCKNAAEVDKKFLELTALGYQAHSQPWDAFWGQRYAVIKDPDGHTVDLFAPL
jgi:catechol 2,3-dioxygenase-like lactoylglutathione lyase family enzyme